jgi:hypothetical protein
VNGRGTFQVTLNIESAGPPSFSLNWADFRFQSDAVAPTPEPAGLVLLATGLAAILGRHVRSRRSPPATI